MDKFRKQDIIKSELIYDGKIIKVYKNDVLLPNDEVSMREIVHHRGGVCILIIDDEYTYLVKQYRNPMNACLLELPAGKLEEAEDPLTGAIRETEEELGFKPLNMESLGYAYVSPGFCDEKIHMFYCDKFEKTSQSLDSDEFLDIIKIKISDLEKEIQDGNIIDAKTICTIYKYLQKKQK